MTETLPPEKVRELWHKARKFIGMTDDDVVYQGDRRLNADVAAAPLPPVVDKGDFAKQVEQGMEEAERWDGLS